MKVLKLATLFLVCLSASAQTLKVYPTAPIAPRGSYQTVTAIVNGVNNKTVTWSTDCGTIVGTNPGTANEPNTIALYSATAQTCHLTATSNANGAVTAVSTPVFTASPTPVSDHPRFLVTSSMLTGLRAKADSVNNPMFIGILNQANTDYGNDNPIWSWTTWNGSVCGGPGTGNPSSDQSGNNHDEDMWLFAQMSMIAPVAADRNTWGCRGRDIFMTTVGYVLSGAINLGDGAGNRWSVDSEELGLTADYLMAGGYLSAADLTNVRAYLAKFAQVQTVAVSQGVQAVIGSYNTPVQFDEANQASLTEMRATGNNYTESRLLVLAAAAYTFNDNTTDDPPLTNTCSATRYQVCPDGTAGSLHAYGSYLMGGFLYKTWGAFEDANIVQPAYNAFYSNLSSQPQCMVEWGSTYPCLGIDRGGESSEGFAYGYALKHLRDTLNMLHTAGLDDPLIYGPQISLSTSSYFDLRYVSDYIQLVGQSASSDPYAWTAVNDGDYFLNYFDPSNLAYETSAMAFDSNTGRTDRKNALEWLTLNTSFGQGTGSTPAGCSSSSYAPWCGYVVQVENYHDTVSDTAWPAFIALPNANPVVTSPPTDPRSSLPTDWYEAGNQHIAVRNNWTSGNTLFSYHCTNTHIDHEHEFCGRFEIYANNEFITKGRSTYTSPGINTYVVGQDSNLPALINTPGNTYCTYANGCFWADMTELGGQFWHSLQAGPINLLHSELPAYVAAIADSTNAYNGGYNSFGTYNGITASSRSLVYLRNSNEVVTYDRAESGANAWSKATFLVATGSPTIAGHAATWLTRSGLQKAVWTNVVPGVAPTLNQTYSGTTNATDDWEVYGRLKVDAGSVTTARFLNVLEWGANTFSPSTPVSIASTAGQAFDGTLTAGETTAVMFMHNWPATFTGTTYPAFGATTHYVANLTPNTTYTVTASGGPGTATTDNAGVMTFTTDGTGNIGLSSGGTPTASTPTFSPVAGTYGSAQNVTISTTSLGAILCYNTTGSPATNGTTGCTTGTLYTGPVTVSTSETLFAVAGGTGYLDSTVGSAAYVITTPAATPTFSPVAGTYTSTQTVTISTTTSGATLCYTTDGTTPTGNGAGTCTHGTAYSVPVTIASSLTLKAIASKAGFSDSTVGSAAYVIAPLVVTPTFSPVAGTYTSTQAVTISSVTSGATLCYTTDGSTPTANGAGTCTHGTTYSTAVSVTFSLTLKAIGSKSGLTDSTVGSAAYVINISGGPATITGAGTITGAIRVE